jgi:hypothetical protein
MGFDEGGLSKEEKEMVSKYFDQLETQANAKLAELRHKVTEQRAEIEKKRSEIFSEYDAVYPHHVADVQFIENVSQAQQAAKGKYEALLFKTNYLASDLDAAMSTLTPVLKESLEPEPKAKKLFSTLERVRVVIIKNGVFLKQLSSTLNSSAINYPIQFNINIDAQPTSEVPQAAERRRRPKLSSRKEASKPATKPLTRKSSMPSGRKGKGASVALEAAKDIDLNTIEGQLEQFRIDFVNSVTTIAFDYYNAVKNRKYNITRPNQIPAGQQELVEQISKLWIDDTKDFGQFYAQVVTKYRYQVVLAYDLGMTTQRAIFGELGEFYRIKLSKERDELQAKFDEEVRDLTKERSANKQKLTARMADANLTSEFGALVDIESRRTTRETGSIAAFKQQVVEWERKVMLAYAKCLPMVTANLLLLFDNFVVTEDLVAGQVPVQRRTMTSLLKDKERRAKGGVQSQDRPFKQREWPTLKVVMGPMPKKERTTPPPTESDAGAKKRPRSRRAMAGPTADQASEAEEMMPVANSLETPLHRSVIIERNREYARYEQEMAKRVAEFDEYVQAMNEDTTSFSQHWATCALALQGRTKFPVRPSSALK